MLGPYINRSGGARVHHQSGKRGGLWLTCADEPHELRTQRLIKTFFHHLLETLERKQSHNAPGGELLDNAKGGSTAHPTAISKSWYLVLPRHWKVQ